MLTTQLYTDLVTVAGEVGQLSSLIQGINQGKQGSYPP